MAAGMPPVPPSLKAIAHHYKTALELDKKEEPVIAYYCRMYVLQEGMKIDRSSPPAKAFLLSLMDKVEADKKAMDGLEEMSNEVAAQAHFENYVLKLFAHADTEDRAARHSKNVVKMFYTAGMLFDVISVFGEPEQDIERYKKYAKYKATYIHKCLKEGIPPQAGPITEEDGTSIDFGELRIAGGQPRVPSSSSLPQNHPPTDQGYYQPDPHVFPGSNYQPPPNNPYQPVDQAPVEPVPYTQPAAQPSIQPAVAYVPPAMTIQGGMVPDSAVDWDKASKMAKFAVSSMTYEDREAAIDYLQKALNLLSVGHE